MLHLAHAIVTAITTVRAGAVECEIDLAGSRQDALVYPDLVGDVSVGDEVIVNTTAVDLHLGTGGLHLVVVILGGSGPMGPVEGHIMKARYTPLQTAVSSVEEHHRDRLEASKGLQGTPVVVAPLHSLLAPICAGAKVAGAERVIYVMTDNAALPLGLSRLVFALREAGCLDGVITCGQSFGGDLEAVSIWSALVAARDIAAADVIVVADGPGSLGTDTRWGAGALAAGDALNAVQAVGGRPVAALRISFADQRERHRGVSHHSLTILRDVALVACNVAVPVLEGEQREAVWDALLGPELERKHQLVEVPGELALESMVGAGVSPTTMGRGISADPAFFLAGGAAGILAGRMAARSLRPPR